MGFLNVTHSCTNQPFYEVRLNDIVTLVYPTIFHHTCKADASIMRKLLALLENSIQIPNVACMHSVLAIAETLEGSSQSVST